MHASRPRTGRRKARARGPGPTPSGCGDGAGFDIESFDTNGANRLIEVKTTNGWERTPFHITRNELAVAEARREHWRLVRLWNFSRRPTAFELRPPLEAHVSLMATSYQADLL